MKKLIRIFSVIILLAFLVSCEDTSGPDYRSGVGSISIISSPSGATVKIEMEFALTTTPVTIKNLNVGEYWLRINKEGFETAYRTAIVRDGRETLVEVNLKPLPE